MATFSYDDLIAWSEEGLRPWLRDALRRLLETGTVADADIEELVRLAKAPHFGDAEATPRPPERSAIAATTGRPPTVVLLGLSDISRVNALVAGPFPFGATGLTALYGDNGSGKSGLVRILKKACRSLDPGAPIRPSIYGEQAGPPPNARIEFSVDGSARTNQWIEGGGRDPELEAVNIFDAASARRQVERENRISYRPAILQVFTDLAAVCDRVKAKIDEERRGLGPRDPRLQDLEAQVGDTAAGRFLRNLTELSDRQQLDRLSTLGSAEARELAGLRTALADSPLDRAASEAARERRVGELEARIIAGTAALNDEAADAFEGAVEAAQAAEEAALVATEAFESGSALAGLGSPAWKALWEAARRYSETHAYPGGDPYPVVRAGALCVLCQQALDDDARVRLRRFEEFVLSDVQQQAEKNRSAIDAARKGIEALDLPRSRAALGDAGLSREGVGDELRRWIILARARRRYLLRRATGKVVGERPSLPAAPDLSALRRSIGDDEKRLRAAATENTRREMERRFLELSDREKLGKAQDLVLKEIDRLQASALLEAASRDCDRRGITRKEGEAANLVLSGRLRAEFAENLAAMGFAAPAVEVELGGGHQGERPYKVRLTATEEVSAADVLSEGERTCVALAGFLAELATAGNRSGIVLDDPVCSLDHRYRDQVARRLAREAQSRQVVVMTHDIVFLWELREHCRAIGVAIELVELERGYREYGRASAGAPWLGKTVRERLGWLRNALQEAEAALRRDGRAAYEMKASLIYTRLRNTWEKSVEELLLNRVVERFRPGVETKRLRELTDITRDDVDQVEREMAHCSRFEHDEPGARNEGIPDPDVVRQDLQRLEAWVEELRTRGRRN